MQCDMSIYNMVVTYFMLSNIDIINIPEWLETDLQEHYIRGKVLVIMQP